MQEFEIPRHELEVLRVSLDSYQGRTFVNLRIYRCEHEGDGEYKATKRGITVAPEQWELFKKGINELTVPPPRIGKDEKIEVTHEAG